MRIAVVHSFYSNSRPSGENSVVGDQVEALSRAGHDVRLFGRYTDVEEGKPGYTLRAAFATAGLSGPSPAKALSEFQPDVVHVHNLFPNWGTDWLKEWGARTVATLHNYRTVCASGLLWRDGHDCRECLEFGSARAVQHRCYRDSRLATLPLAYSTRRAGGRSVILNEASSIVVLNRVAKELFQGIVAADISLVPNFVRPAGGVLTEPRDGWLFVGRLSPEKGIEWLLNNWPSQERLRIAGSGPLEDLVRARAALDPHMFEYLGMCSPSEVQELLGSSVGLIVPSLWSEGIPTVALEALQCGTPLIISNRCAASRELLGGGSGRAFRIEDGSSGLRSVFEDIRSDPSYQSRAREWFSLNFSEPVWRHRIERVYERVVDRSG